MSRLANVMVTLAICEAKGYYIPTTLRDRLYYLVPSWLGDYLNEHEMLTCSGSPGVAIVCCDVVLKALSVTPPHTTAVNACASMYLKA